MSRAPPLLNSHRFSVLEVTELEVDEDAQEPSEPPALPPAKPRKLRRPKCEKQIKRKLVIRSLEMDAKCIMIPTHLKTTDTMEETSTEAMVDTGATGDFINQDFVTREKLPTRKLSQPIPVYNVDGTLNEAGSIREVVDINSACSHPPWQTEHDTRVHLVGQAQSGDQLPRLIRKNDQMPPALLCRLSSRPQGGTERKKGGHRTDKHLLDWVKQWETYMPTYHDMFSHQ